MVKRLAETMLLAASDLEKTDAPSLAASLLVLGLPECRTVQHHLR